MRILIPLHSFEPGGVERVAMRLAHEWRGAGHGVHLVLGRDQGLKPGLADGLEFDVLQQHRLPIAAAFETLWMITKLPERIRSVRPDVIFCPGNSYAVVGAVLKLIMGEECPPLVLKISNDLARADLAAPARLFYRSWCRLQGLLFDGFVAIARSMRREVRLAMGVEAARVAVIDNPVLRRADIGRLGHARSLADRGHDGRRYLAIGRLVPQKNFALLIRAFARIAGADDRLAILGDGPRRRALEKLAARLGVGDRVMLPGHVEPVEDWFAGADMFVLSSDYEGLPAVVVEAMASGLPVLATRCSASMPALVEEGRLGRLVPPRDEVALAEAMDAPGGGEPERASARAEQFTVERAGEEYLLFFRAIARGRDGQGAASPINMVAGRHVPR